MRRGGWGRWARGLIWKHRQLVLRRAWLRHTREGVRPGEEVGGGEGHPTPSRARQHPISSQLKIDFCAKLSQTDSGASLPVCACVEDKLGGDVNQRHRNNVCLNSVKEYHFKS